MAERWILTKRVCTFDTDLRLCDILYDWHRSGVLRYSSHRHRLETLSFLAHVTQTWDSEIFCTSDTESRLWDILHGWHSTGDLRFSPNGDTDTKDWDIQRERHRPQDLRYSAWQTQIKSLRYSVHLTQISRPEIFHARHKTNYLRYSTRQTQISRPEILNTSDNDSKENWKRIFEKEIANDELL